jgi:hypothetical protein
MNRLRGEQRAAIVAAERELARVKNEIEKLIDAIVQGAAVSQVKARLASLDHRKEILSKQLESSNAPPPLLHPGMAELYRNKVTELARALEHPDGRSEAAESIRGLIDGIVLTLDKGKLRIELRGNLAAMLDAAQNKKSSPENGKLVQLQCCRRHSSAASAIPRPDGPSEEDCAASCGHFRHACPRRENQLDKRNVSITALSAPGCCFRCG